MGKITVKDFERAVKEFGFNSPVVTAIWNTMYSNPDNQEEFETIYARRYAGMYKQLKAT